MAHGGWVSSSDSKAAKVHKTYDCHGATTSITIGDARGRDRCGKCGTRTLDPLQPAAAAAAAGARSSNGAAKKKSAAAVSAASDGRSDTKHSANAAAAPAAAVTSATSHGGWVSDATNKRAKVHKRYGCYKATTPITTRDAKTLDDCAQCADMELDPLLCAATAAAAAGDDNESHASDDEEAVGISDDDAQWAAQSASDDDDKAKRTDAKDAKDVKSTASAGDVGWVQLCDRTTPRYKDLMAHTDWSPWHPYLIALDAPKKGNHLRMYKANEGVELPPQQFGVYCIGVLPPDVVNDMPNAAAAAAAASHMIIVNHGVAGRKPNESNSTLRKRLQSYTNKMKTHEWAVWDWVRRGFKVFVRWRVVQSDAEFAKQNTQNIVTTKDGARMRCKLETQGLQSWQFFLNTHHQTKDVSAKLAAEQLPVPKYKARAQTTASHWSFPAEAQKARADAQKQRALDVLQGDGSASAKVAAAIAVLSKTTPVKQKP